MAMVYVSGGEFQMGSDDDEVDAALEMCQAYYTTPCQRAWFEVEQPVHAVALDGFWLDRTEVKSAQYRRCVEAGACDPPQRRGSDTRNAHYGDSAYDDYLVVHITWGQADAYCHWAGGRLPTEAEWECAARGPEGRRYPWGEAYDGTRLNSCDANCMYDWAEEAVDDGHGDAALVGSYPGGASWCGVLDMAGNVWEWMADWFGEYPEERQANLTGPSSGTGRALRGDAADGTRLSPEPRPGTAWNRGGCTSTLGSGAPFRRRDRNRRGAGTRPVSAAGARPADQRVQLFAGGGVGRSRELSAMRRFLLILTLLAVVCCCAPQTTAPPMAASVSRLAAIPTGVGKVAPAKDAWPPQVAPGWSRPVAVGGLVNTAGAEDSPFVTPDGGALYFFFTPDLNVPADEQLLDGVTGIWLARRAGEGWSGPERLPLAEPGELHLDGCPMVLGAWMVFCSARAGNSREVDLYTATLHDGTWTDVQNWGEPFNTDYDVGEMHITADGAALYYASARPGGLGGLDLWVSFRTGDGWGEPVNLGPPVNTSADENRPFANGEELWFDAPSRQGLPGPAIFRASRQPDGSWGEPEEVVSSFAGEPSLTGDGRVLYSVHHYLSADMGRMIEADLYVTERLERE